MPQTQTLLHQLNTHALSSLDSEPDAGLLGRFVDRQDEGAFGALLARHGPMVWAVCHRVLRNSHDAEEAFQATFLVLAMKGRTVSPRERVGNWLYGVAYHAARKARVERSRRASRERSVGNPPDSASPDPSEANDLSAWLDHELARLSDRHRAPVVLCDLEGLTLREAASRLGCPVGTIASRLARGREALAERLTRRGVVFTLGALTGLTTRAVANPPADLLKVVRATALRPDLAVGHSAALAKGVIATMLLKKTTFASLILGAVLVCGLAVAGLPLAAPEPAAKNAEDETPKLATPANPPDAKGDVPGGGKPPVSNVRLPSKATVKLPTELEKFQGLWEDTLGEVVHKDGVEAVRQPAGRRYLFILGDHVIWLGADGQPTGNEDRFTLDVTTDPKRIFLEHDRIGGNQCVSTPESGIFRVDESGIEVHFALGGAPEPIKFLDGIEAQPARKAGPPPAQFLELNKPTKGLDGRTWRISRTKLEPTGPAKAPTSSPLLVRYSMPVYRPTLPTAEWSGLITDPKLRSAAPESDHLILDAATWRALWGVWRKGEAVPEVNFKTEVLLVFTAQAMNIPSVQLYDGGGSVTAKVSRTVLGGNGFGYRIIKIPREGLHSVLGQNVEVPKIDLGKFVK